jgi:hypothetical protein
MPGFRKPKDHDVAETKKLFAGGRSPALVWCNVVYVTLTAEERRLSMVVKIGLLAQGQS